MTGRWRGGTPSAANSQLYYAARAYFGTYAKAVEAAGVDYAQVRQQSFAARAAARPPATPAPAALAETRQAIARLHREGVDLSYTYMSGAHRRLVRRAAKQFGSWTRAVEAAGIDYAPYRRHQQWTPERVLDQLRQRQSAGDDLSPGHMATSVIPLYQAASNHFGSYRAAVEAAGIPYDQVARQMQESWDRQKILETLRRLRAEGADVSRTNVRRTFGKLEAAIDRHFPTYQAAIEAAGINYDSVRHPGRRAGGAAAPGHWTEQSVLRALRDLHADGHDLRYTSMKKRNQPLFYAAKELFGSYVNAVRQAGIDYWGMSQAQLARERRERAEQAAAAREP